MSEWDLYRQLFEKSSLEDIYTNHIIFSSATGIDKVSHDAFMKALGQQLEIVSTKAMVGKYKYTKYRLKLISKGRGKIPREISIPTIRDRVALKALCEFLNQTFVGDVSFDLPQNVVRAVKAALDSGKYSAFIKLDVEQFYPTIDHDVLMGRLKSKISKQEILDQIALSYSTPTVEKPSEGGKNEKGVPQGLSVSNILAAIYLAEVDTKFRARDFAYFRYVDDILILCAREEAKKIADEVIGEFEKIGLSIHKPDGTSEKSKIGVLAKGSFSYLGYRFEDGRATVRSESIERLRESLTAIFTAYKYSKKKDQKFLKWRLDLRISGCIFEKKRKGWLFFFSEIDDLNLLHELDHFVRGLCKRFDVEIKPKSFVRSYYQLKHHIYETRYIQNFDTYSVAQMKGVLEDVFDYKDLDEKTDRQIVYYFKKKLTKQVKDLEEDLQDFGY